MNALGRPLAGQCKSLYGLLPSVRGGFSGSNVRLSTRNGAESIDLRKVLILNKITRYEFEKRRYPNLDETEQKAQVRYA